MTTAAITVEVDRLDWWHMQCYDCGKFMIFLLTNNNLGTFVMFDTAASTSKKRLNLSTPHNSGIGERMVVSSPKTRAVWSQRGRSRRGRVPKHHQTPLSGRTADTELAPSTAGHTVASRILAETSQLNGRCTFFILLVIPVVLKGTLRRSLTNSFSCSVKSLLYHVFTYKVLTPYFYLKWLELLSFILMLGNSELRHQIFYTINITLWGLPKYRGYKAALYSLLNTGVLTSPVHLFLFIVVAG